MNYLLNVSPTKTGGTRGSSRYRRNEAIRSLSRKNDEDYERSISQGTGYGKYARTLQDVNRLDCLDFLQELDELFQPLAATLQISSYVKSDFHRLDAT